jgi:hypothetical protein
VSSSQHPPGPSADRPAPAGGSEWHWDPQAAQQPPQQTAGPVAPRRPRRWARLKRWAFSNLNLNGRTPPRVQPTIGEWGPANVPTTGQKKRMRIYVLIALPAAMLACFLLGWYVYFLMTGCYGFGFGCRNA